MTRTQKRRRKCSEHNASAYAMDPRPASQVNDIASAVDSTAASASVVDSRPASWDKGTASAIDSRPASMDKGGASAVDSRPASWDKGVASALDSRPASKDNGAASVVDSRPAAKDNGPASSVVSRPGSKEDASASAFHFRPASSFEFSVTSEKGINLYVDMNSSLVDWHKRLENGMCICRCVEENKSPSFREQLLYLGYSRKQAQDSFGRKSENRIKDSNSSFVSSPNSLNRKGDDRFFSHRDTENWPSEIFAEAAAACSSAREDSNFLEEHKEQPASISSNSGTISRTRPGKKESMDPNDFHVPQGKTAYSSKEALAVDKTQNTLNNKKLYGEISTRAKIKMERDKKDVTPLHDSLEITAVGSQLPEVSCLEKIPAFLSLSDDSSRNLIDVDHSMETAAQELDKSSANESHTHSNILPAKGKV